LTFVVITVQFLVALRYWRVYNLLDLATAPLLVLLVATQAYGGVGHHFLWVAPLLTISLFVNPREAWLFLLTFLAASPWPTITFTTDTFQWGVFFAAKAAYLLKTNLRNTTALNVSQYRSEQTTSPFMTEAL